MDARRIAQIEKRRKALRRAMRRSVATMRRIVRARVAAETKPVGTDPWLLAGLALLALAALMAAVAAWAFRWFGTD